MAAQPLPVPSLQTSVTFWASSYVPAAGVAVVVGAAASTTYVAVFTVSVWPTVSTEKSFSVVLVAMEMAAVYFGELVVGSEPSVVK